MPARLPALVLALALAACGGGGGAPAAAAAVPPGRAVPGGMVAVAAAGAGSFRLTVTVADVAAVEVLRGAGYDGAAAVAVAPDGPGAWTGSAPAGSPLLVRLTLADGAVIETAPGDFAVR